MKQELLRSGTIPHVFTVGVLMSFISEWQYHCFSSYGYDPLRSLCLWDEIPPSISSNKSLDLIPCGT